MLYFEGFKNPYGNDLSPSPWEQHYALLPKDINGKLVWLKHYYSRYEWTEYKAGDGYSDHKWTERFGTIFDVLKEG